MCSGFLVIDVFSLLLCFSLLDGSPSVVVGLFPCTALLDWYQHAVNCQFNSSVCQVEHFSVLEYLNNYQK